MTKKRHCDSEIQRLIDIANYNGGLDDSEILKLLSSLSNEQIKKIQQIMDAITLKAESENIIDSSDLLMKHIPKFSYEIVLPYNHFPETIKPFEINNLVQILRTDFDVLYSARSSSDAVSVRFHKLNNDAFTCLKKIIDAKSSEILEKEKNTYNGLQEKLQQNENYLKSIHLITQSVVVKDVIFLVFDEHFEMPIRFDTRNIQGGDTAIKKLHDLAYMVNVQNKMVTYNEGTADNINNGIFRRRAIVQYMRTNKIKKPTLVQKSEDDQILVLKNELPVKTILVNAVPSQYQYLYIDKIH